MTTDLKWEKLNLQQSQNNVLLYGCSCYQSLEYYTVAVGPNLPVVRNTNELNLSSRMPSSYALHMPVSFLF